MTAAASSVSGLAPSLDDTIQGTAGDDSLHGSGLNDLIQGLDGDDTLLGSAGDDVLRGGPGDDSLSGGSGNDTLWGGAGNNTLVGGSGRDVFLVTDLAKSVVDGGSGQDSVSFELVDSAVDISLASPDKHLTSIEEAVGSEFADTLIAGLGRSVMRGSGGDDYIACATTSTAGDLFFGDGGDDYLRGSLGADRLKGGSGNDRLDAGNDNAGDLVQGGAGKDTLIVGYGDRAEGGARNDLLIAGVGGDTLVGGSGSDRFTFNQPTAAVASILDLTAEDVIDLSHLDADVNQGRNQAFVLVDRFDHHAGEIRLAYGRHADQTRLLLDWNGDARPDMTILLSGDQTDFTHFRL